MRLSRWRCSSAAWLSTKARTLSRLSPAYPLAALFALAFLVRLVYLLQIKDTAFFRVLIGDSVFYDRWALDIQNDWVGKEPFYQAPLYPYFLAVIYSVFGHNTFAVRLIQIALGSAACVLLALGGRRFFSRPVAMIAGFLLAVYAPAIFFDGIVHKASLDLCLVAALVFGLSKMDEGENLGSALFTGVVAGCLSLTRENALVLIPVIVLWIGWRFRKARSNPGNIRHNPEMFRLAAAFLLGSFVPLGPVALRNYAVGHELLLTTSQFGVNFYLGNNEHADGLYEPLQWGHGSYPLERQDAIDLAENDAGRRLTPREVSHYWSSRAWGWIRSHPAAWLRLTGKKALLVWNANEIPDSDEPAVYRDASWVLRVLASVFVFGTVCPLAVAGVVATWSERRRLVPLYLIALSIAGSATLFIVLARYRLPMLPVILLFAAAALVDLASLARERRTRALVGRGLCVGAAGLVVSLKLGVPGNQRAMAYYNLAVSLEQNGELDEAMANYRRAIDNQADFIQAHVNLGSLLARSGAFAEAVAEEQLALGLRPDDAIAHTNLANALFELRRLDEAEAHYRAALRVQPDLESAQAGLAAIGDTRAGLLAK